MINWSVQKLGLVLDLAPIAASPVKESKDLCTLIDKIPNNKNEKRYKWMFLSTEKYDWIYYLYIYSDGNWMNWKA